MYRLRVFEKRMLRRILGSENDDITEVWRRLHNGALRSILLSKYYLSDQIKKNQMGRACSMYGRQEICIQGFGGET